MGIFSGFQNKLQKTKLQIEIEARNVIAVKNLLKTNPSLVTATYQNNYTALHLAAHEGQKAIVKTLISYGADLQAQRSFVQYEPGYGHQSKSNVYQHILAEENFPDAGDVAKHRDVNPWETADSLDRAQHFLEEQVAKTQTE